MSLDALFHIDSNSEHSLQKQIIEQITRAIVNGNLPTDTPLPSSRHLSSQLKVGRNTVIFAYERLLSDGYLISKEHSGYFVNLDILEGYAPAPAKDQSEKGLYQPNWAERLKLQPSGFANIEKPKDWQRYPYPFIYGQIGSDLFPLNNWRECCRDAVSVKAIHSWSMDQSDNDDPLLIEQIQKRLLPRRDVWANADEILITVGAQHALYLLAEMLFDKNSTIGLEDPGYVDVRNIVSLGNSAVKPLPVNSQGLIVNDNINDCDYIYVTPSHQSPTTVTMPLKNRHALLEQAANNDIILLEDDYESESNYQSDPLPALKSLDVNDRVLYISSLSKTISAGLRMGYVVGPAKLISELRALRRLMLRHPAANNQHSMALFLSRGYHESLVKNLHRTYKTRFEIMSEELSNIMPISAATTALGGSSFWIEGPKNLDARVLAEEAKKIGIIIEPGDLHFYGQNPPKHFFRLGFSAIKTEQIKPGLKLLADLINKLT
jgi:GntR family transcriptional regulator/MocR family aminotransferase